MVSLKTYVPKNDINIFQKLYEFYVLIQHMPSLHTHRQESHLSFYQT